MDRHGRQLLWLVPAEWYENRSLPLLTILHCKKNSNNLTTKLQATYRLFDSVQVSYVQSKKVLSREATPFPSCKRLQASTSPCRPHPPKKRASIKEPWSRLEKARGDFEWDFRRRHKGQKSFAFVCRWNGSDEPGAAGAACHRGPDLLWELISIIWAEAVQTGGIFLPGRAR